MNKTKERAKEILNLYLDEVKAFDFVKSMILVGPISDNTYTGNAGSDIDLIHIVADEIDYGFEKTYLNLLRLCHKNRFSPDEITEQDIETMNKEYQTCYLKRPKTWNK